MLEKVMEFLHKYMECHYKCNKNLEEITNKNIQESILLKKDIESTLRSYNSVRKQYGEEDSQLSYNNTPISATTLKE